MTEQSRDAITRFVGALERCATVRTFRSSVARIEGNPESLRAVEEMAARIPLNDLIALHQSRGDYADEPILREYLDARVNVIQLLQQIDSIISNQIRISISASLRPTSC